MMDLTTDNTDFYGLVTDLCGEIVGKSLSGQHANKREKILKKVRTKAFEILLKNHPTARDNNDNQQNEGVYDPCTELLKYAFVLRSTFGHASKATRLEEKLDELQDLGTHGGSLLSILEFLNCMKNYEPTERNDLNIFYFGEKNPLLPDFPTSPNTPDYQTYPSSTFQLPYNIEESSSNLLTFSTLPMTPPFSLPTHNSLEPPSDFSKLFQQSPSTPMLMTSTYYLVEEDSSSEPGFWEHTEQLCEDVGAENPPDNCLPPMNFSWTNISDEELLENKNWENLGNPHPPLPSTFILESGSAVHHLQNFRKFMFLEGSLKQTKLPRRISLKEFIEDIKLLLLGIESDTFLWNTKIGFVFKSNTTIPKLSNDALKDICAEVIEWAMCFRLLNLLVRPGPNSQGKLREEGLIFKAMCTNVDEILIHYQAVILQVFSEDTTDLLSLLHRLRPVGCLISEVARLCRCDNIRQTLLGEGIGLLSHIYKQVTRITKPNIALVYYSVLKSCCEIYFEFLEKWIFEGKCDESYGEFMVNIRLQYLRTRGHKFWSKCFGINRESVPGFLQNLTDSILQCGKAVRLLKICDPKNPICTLFSHSHPPVKVCLNVNMLSEQEENCQEYLIKGMEILGNVTFNSALQQLKIIEKNKAEQVMMAQQGTLQRIKKSQEEAKLLIAKNKRELLANLKNQADEAVFRKEKAREAKILEEKLELEKQIAEEEEERRLQQAEAKATLDYYKALAEEAKKRKLRAHWRARRMALFDERLESMMAARKEESSINSHTIEHNRQQLEVLGLSDLNDKKDENSNSSEDTSQRTISSVIEIATRPTDLFLRDKIQGTKDTNTSNLAGAAMAISTEAILNEITESKNRLISTKTPGFLTKASENNDDNLNLNTTIEAAIISENLVVLDDEGNESVIQMAPTQCHQNPQESSQILDNVDNTEPNHKETMELQNVQLANDPNDVTPMSCTTDSYLHSMASSSLFYNCLEVGSLTGSKNDFETPLSPEERLPKTNKQNIPESHSFFSGFGMDTNGPMNFESSLTMADVELIDNTSLQIYLEKSVMIPLMAQSKLANSAVVKYLLEDHKILSHLQSLRRFFFLLNGEFARNLTGALFKKFYEISLPIELFNSATLTNLLENAVHSSLSSSYANAELLSLSAIDPPNLLTLSDPEALDCLCLHYKICWPLNIVLDEVLMQQYSKVFKFLLMVGRVLWVLQEDFCILKIERKAARSPQYHRLQLFRHAMMQFMTAFSNYLTCSVLHASWTEFEKDLENATTLDEIYSTHVSYIKKILSRCMLTSKAEKLRQCLCNIFKIILKFHNCLRSHEWHFTSNGYTISNYNKLEQMYEAFCDLRTYPAHVVEKLASSGYQSHLTHFLDSLNINPLYNLSTKGV